MKKVIAICLSAMVCLSAMAKPKAEVPPSKIGILWSSWSVSNFANHEDYIASMNEWGIEYVSLNPTYFLDTYAKGILTEWNGETVTPTFDNQKEIIKALIANGYYINYRPHVDPIIYAMPEGNDRSTWSTDPGGKDWRGLFDKLDPTDPKLGYKEKIVLPGLNMIANAIRESEKAGKKLRTPIRFDLGAELMNSMLNYPQHWSDLRDEVKQLLNTTYADVKSRIVIGHNFCHHIEYLLRLDGHLDYFTRIMADQKPDYSLLYLDRPGVTDETRKLIGRYIAGLDEMSISQYMPLDIFTPAGQTTTPDEVMQALYWHEDNFIKECLIKECGVKPEELPVLHIGEYGMGWRGLAAPNVWDVAAWERAGNKSMILSEAQQKADAAIAIDGIIKYVEDPTDTQYRSFLLWFGGSPYDLLNINSYSNWYNPPAAASLKAYWERHKGLPDLSKPDIDYNLEELKVTAVAGSYQTKNDDDNDGLVTFAVDGSNSKSENGNIVAYQWSLNEAVLANTAKADLTLPVGVHSVVLTVTDEKGYKGTAKTVLTAVAAPSGVQALDDFEGYASDDALRGAWQRNGNGAQITASVNTEFAMQGKQAMQLTYDLSGNTYAGVMKSGNSDVKGYDGIRYLVKGDGSGADLLIQLRDDNDHYWKYTIQLTSTEPQEVFMPFTDFVGGYNTSGKWTNPSAVTEVAFYVEKGTKGTIYIDDLRASSKTIVTRPTADAGEDIFVELAANEFQAEVQLQGSAKGNVVSWRWSEAGNTLATTQNANVSFAAGKHLVYLTVTDENGNSDTDYLYVEIKAVTTDIDTNADNNSSLVAYPNPADGFARINVPEGATAILVYDATGRQVLAENTHGRTMMINTSGLNNGLYIIRAIGADFRQGKLVVKH